MLCCCFIQSLLLPMKVLTHDPVPSLTLLLYPRPLVLHSQLAAPSESSYQWPNTTSDGAALQYLQSLQYSVALSLMLKLCEVWGDQSETSSQSCIREIEMNIALWSHAFYHSWNIGLHTGWKYNMPQYSLSLGLILELCPLPLLLSVHFLLLAV
jgi:hypothetical protein